MKTPLYTFIAALALCFSFSTAYAQCDWETVGLDNDMFFIEDSSSNYRPSIASDQNGVQYVAYSDGQHAGKITVKRYVNGYWSTMGNAGFSDGKADLVKIAVNSLNQVYVAYKDLANGKKITVKYFSGFGWMNVGSPGFSPLKVDDIDLAIDMSVNKPYVTFCDSTARITVMSFNGTTWNNVGSTGFSAGIVSSPGIVAAANTPYVVYNDYGHAGRMYVMKFNGASWDSVGTLWSFGNTTPVIALDNSNVPHVAFMDYSVSKASVVYFNGGSWQYLGSPGISSNSMFWHELVFDASNNAFLAYANLGSSQTGELAKYSGGAWSVLGQMFVPPSTSIPSQYARFCGVSVNNVTGEPFMLYTQNNVSPLFGMKDWGIVKWNGTDFENSNGKSITGVVSYGSNGMTANFDFDPNGIPYVSYTDSLNGQKASVKKFNGTDWVFVGTPGFSNGTTEFNSIAFDTAGVPYVSFRENGTSPSVMKFTGTSWVYVGSSMFYPAGVGAFTSLAINPVTNEPYIFFDDASMSFKGTCMRFDGANWVNVGISGFTTGGVFSKSIIAFNSAGTPYIAYGDGSLGNKLVVMNYTGSSWVNTGTNPLSAGLAGDFGLTIDAAGDIYVVYTDGGQSYKVTCKKFNGTSWNSVGPFLTAGYANGCDIAVDHTGNIFVYYTEQYLNYDPGTVKRYFNNTWVTVGRPHIFPGTAQTNDIRINPATGLPAIGSLLAANFNEGKGYYVKTLPCNFNTAVNGTVYYDTNSDCAQNGGESLLSNQPVVLSQGSNASVTFTDNMGKYFFTAIPAGTYTVGMGNLQNGYNVQCANSQPHNTIVSANTLNTEDFALACTPQFDFIAGSVTPYGNWWPGQQVSMVTHAWVNKTVCYGAPTPGTIKLVFPPCIKYVADTTLLLQPDTVHVLASGDTVTYNVTDVYNLSPLFFNSLITRAQICTTAVSGDTLCVQLIVSAANDANTVNNVYTRCVPIQASYDPNNKEVTPAGVGAAGVIPGSTLEMYYTINFQNTGTAPAVNIVIKDTISQHFEISTFQILASSHPMAGTSITDNIVTFNFPNIMLPDSSSDELNSHGFVSYKVNLKYGLAPLTEIKNTAYIYFDYNPPIVTNTTLNTLDLTADMKEDNLKGELQLYPNPTKGELFLTRSVGRAELYDVRGARLGSWKNCAKISLGELAEGVYFVRAIEEDGNVKTFKVVCAK